MPRQARSAPAGYIYHVTNHANGNTKLFAKDSDYDTFQQVLMEAIARVPTRLLGWCLMPDHWHLILWPKREGELSAFVRAVTLTHTQRRHSQQKTAGQGHIYQGRFKSFPVQKAEPLLDVLKFIESNGLRAKKVKKAEAWQWSSLHARRNGPKELRGILEELPVKLPADWVKRVNRAFEPEELETLRSAVKRSSPYGTPDWKQKTAKALNLEWTLRPRGRPRLKPVKPAKKK